MDFHVVSSFFSIKCYALINILVYVFLNTGALNAILGDKIPKVKFLAQKNLYVLIGIAVLPSKKFVVILILNI